MACLFTSSVPCGETIVQPHGQVPTAPMQVVSTAVYLSLETRINCSAADSHSIATMSSFPKSRHLESFSVSHHSGDLHSDCLSWKFGFRFTSKLQVRGVGFEHEFTSKSPSPSLGTGPAVLTTEQVLTLNSLLVRQIPLRLSGMVLSIPILRPFAYREQTIW